MSHNVNTRNCIDGTHYCCSAVPVHTGCSGSVILSHSGSPRLARNTHSPVEPNRTDTCNPWIPESTDPLDLRVKKSQSCLIKHKYLVARIITRNISSFAICVVSLYRSKGSLDPYDSSLLRMLRHVDSQILTDVLKHYSNFIFIVRLYTRSPFVSLLSRRAQYGRRSSFGNWVWFTESHIVLIIYFFTCCCIYSIYS